VKIEVLYIDGCPNHGRTVERVNELLKELRLPAELIEVPVTDFASALAHRFLGSPTVKINGIDVEPSARTLNQFGLMCRTYLDGTNRDGVPCIEWIRQGLEQAQLSENGPLCR
jgi:hypothetical protein